jgi:electron transfer flavoprotein beta subunit
LKIIACIKQTPDSEAKVKAENGQATWGDASLVINPFDEYAVEAALQQKEIHNGTVTALCIGPESAKDALKHALAMGADDAVHVCDAALAELDTLGAARVLASAIQKIGGADLIIFGRQSIDTSNGVTPAQTARLLSLPFLGMVGAIKIENDSVHVERVIDEGKQSLGAKLPVVMSVVQSIGEPRYPSFMGIRKAGKAEIPMWSLADLNLSAPTKNVNRIEVSAPPTRDASCEIISGSSPEEIANVLADKIIAEKVL